MFEFVTPESVGVSSENVKALVEYLNGNGLATHSFMLVRGDKVFAKCFWKPFNENTRHRMYSQTKSFVGIAVCELIARGQLKLQDKIVDYFEDKLPEVVPQELKSQTIEDMLSMKTCMSGNYWFGTGVTDRLKYYFSCKPTRKPNTSYFYDSDGSFVLGCLVERVTGKKFLDFIRELFLDEIGFSKEARMFEAPGGHTWSDSSMICRTEDICRFARLLANGGVWEGKHLLDKNMIKAAISKHTDTSSETSPYSSCGYGYQIWMNPKNGFSFLGMHGQYMHYDPKTDIIFACTSGNPEGEYGQIIFDGVDKYIFSTASEKLDDNKKALDELNICVSNLKLLHSFGDDNLLAEKSINRAIYRFNDNLMGISWMKFSFDADKIVLDYENVQGVKKIVCGRNENIEQLFPQTGYSELVGGFPSVGNAYKCMASAAWKNEETLFVKIQIIDDYIGILDMKFRFIGDTVTVLMQKDAEDFLREYYGTAVGTKYAN